jgi:capsule polysaccharide export protein KpsE/RkpR
LLLLSLSYTPIITFSKRFVKGFLYQFSKSNLKILFDTSSKISKLYINWGDENEARHIERLS